MQVSQDAVPTLNLPRHGKFVIWNYNFPKVYNAHKCRCASPPFPEQQNKHLLHKIDRLYAPTLDLIVISTSNRGLFYFLIFLMQIKQLFLTMKTKQLFLTNSICGKGLAIFAMSKKKQVESHYLAAMSQAWQSLKRQILRRTWEGEVWILHCHLNYTTGPAGMENLLTLPAWLPLLSCIL